MIDNDKQDNLKNNVCDKCHNLLDSSDQICPNCGYQNNFSEAHNKETMNRNKNFDNILQENKKNALMFEKQNQNKFTFSIVAYIIGFYILVNVIQIVLVILYPIIFGTPAFIDPSTPTEFTADAQKFLIGLSNISIYLLMSTFLFIYLKKSIYFDFKVFWKNKSIYFVIIIVGCVLLLASNVICNFINQLFNVSDIPTNQSVIYELLASNYKIPMGFVLVIGAPIVEELVFRKSLFAFLGKYIKKIWLIIILTGIIFGSIHFIPAIINDIALGYDISVILNELVLGFTYIAMGCVFGLLYHYSGNNIITTFFMHLIINALSLISYFLI